MATWIRRLERRLCKNSVAAPAVFWSLLIFWLEVLMCSKFRSSSTSTCLSITRTTFTGVFRIALYWINQFANYVLSLLESVEVVVSAERVMPSTLSPVTTSVTSRASKTFTILISESCLITTTCKRAAASAAASFSAVTALLRHLLARLSVWCFGHALFLFILICKLDSCF